MCIAKLETEHSSAGIRRAGLYRVFGKRAFDVAFAAAVLLVLSPLFLLLAMLVKLTSKGPILYSQGRVGLDGRIFQIRKFRSMHIGADRAGPALTCSGDRRITRIGRWLRCFKVDELPQLWNVLVGDMSLVGPRPEHPVYVEGYNAEQRQVFTIRPGITDTASIVYRNEEDLLRRASDPERFYREVVLPRKLSLSLAYLNEISASKDLELILQTVKSVVSSRPDPICRS